MSPAPQVLPGADDHAKLQALAKLTYKQQAIWFLNAFWETNNLESDAETLWKYAHTSADLDLQEHEDGCGLDEVNAHRFLEVYNETLTVRELRGKLRSTGALEESERPKVVPLTHFLLFKYNVDWHKLVNASQGDNSEAIAKAQKMLDEVQAAFRESDEKHQAAAASFREAEAKAKAAAVKEADAKSTEADAASTEADAKSTEAAATAKEADAVEQEAPFKAAQEQLEAALAEVKKQEDEYQGKIADCEKRSEEGGVVSRNKAKAELAQLRAEDPLPLSKAKITLGAAHKRAEKTRAPFEAATKAAQEARAAAAEARAAAEQARAAAAAAAQAASQARAVAEEAKAESERDKIAAAEAVEEAKRRVQEAEDFLEEIKSQPGCAHGAIWWMDRELHEAKAYKPESQGGYRKK